jgi:hypothetical protein
MLFDGLQEAVSGREASKQYLRILELAAKEGEAKVDESFSYEQYVLDLTASTVMIASLPSAFARRTCWLLGIQERARVTCCVRWHRS